MTDSPDPTTIVTTIADRIVGKRIVAVVTIDSSSTLILDDDTRLRLYCSEQDCCASAGGSWNWVVDDDQLDAIITAVELRPDLERSGPNGGEYDGNTNYATIAILHNQNPIALADCYADDGNGGYYYSILSLNVAVPNQRPVDLPILSS